MSVQLMQQGRPPWVTFQQRAEEDRDATIAAGRLVLKDVDYAVIRQIGGKDTVEKIVGEWLSHCDLMASKGNYPGEWVTAHRGMYEQWKAGQEVVPPGFPIRQWAGVSKAQAENLALAGILTVEDLAAASEQGMSKIGMGARALKDKAQAWIDSSKGNSGEELAALRVENSTLKQSIGELQEKTRELEAAINSLQPAKRRA
jgi:hypothetical protein